MKQMIYNALLTSSASPAVVHFLLLSEPVTHCPQPLASCLMYMCMHMHTYMYTYTHWV